ncbi:unnamed protein product [Auanema sp. JU1783]|nr:unnamed protein product [Auanema sp. JU1783]
MKSLLVSVIILAISIFWIASARHVPDPITLMKDLEQVEDIIENPNYVEVDPSLFRNFLHVFRKKFLPNEAYDGDYYDA